MDPTQLVNPNIPFDDNKLALLETIVTTFYSTKNANDVKKKF
jgi:hypothetical protein